MAPVIHCVRHAQGFHNLGSEFHSLLDPRLTLLGEEQCLTLRNTSFPGSQSSISLVTASALSRTIHTAAVTFSPALSNGKAPPTILALPDAQETSDYPCDTGSEPSVLVARAAEHGWPVDLSLVHDGWNIKTPGSRYSPASDAIKARARATRLTLREKARELVSRGDENAEIVLVTHGGFLHYFVDDWEEADLYSGTGWRNCETRNYTFNDGLEDDGDARLVETMQSREGRGKGYPMYGPEEQKALFEQGMQGWEDQGLQRPDRLGKAMDMHGEDAAAKNMSLDRATGEVEVMA